MFPGVFQNDPRPAGLLHRLYRGPYHLLQPNGPGKAQRRPRHWRQPEYERQHRSHIWTKTGSGLFYPNLRQQHQDIPEASCPHRWFSFRALQLQSLLPFRQVSPSENIVEEYGLKDGDLPKQLFT